jgi:hypothetical protein
MSMFETPELAIENKVRECRLSSGAPTRVDVNVNTDVNYRGSLCLRSQNAH